MERQTPVRSNNVTYWLHYNIYRAHQRDVKWTAGSAAPETRYAVGSCMIYDATITILDLQWIDIHWECSFLTFVVDKRWLGGLLVERRTSVSQVRGSIPGQVAAV